MAEPKLEVVDLEQHFPVDTGLLSQLFSRGASDHIRAVDGVSFSVDPGESFGLAGESGCGKTTLGKTSIRLLEPTGGTIRFEGEDVSDIDGKPLRSFRKEAQIIQQNPYQSINPRFTVFNWVNEPLKVHGIGTREKRIDRVYETLEKVGLNPPQSYVNKYPSDLSGGERQRVGIARALVINPSFLVADEPVSMLDVSIRASVLDLLGNLQDDLGLTSIYISHDLSMLKHVCDRIGIMYLGKLVEVGPADEVINDPKHPYTKALVSSIPIIDPDIDRDHIELPGQVPDPVDIPDQCRFYHRCHEAMDECTESEPPMFEVGAKRNARCILYKDNRNKATGMTYSSEDRKATREEQG